MPCTIRQRISELQLLFGNQEAGVSGVQPDKQDYKEPIMITKLKTLYRKFTHTCYVCGGKLWQYSKRSSVCTHCRKVQGV